MTPTNTPTSKCCEKCDAEMWDGPKEKCYSQGQCPCHTPTTDSKNSSQEWEKEFDYIFPTLSVSTKNLDGLGYDIVHRTSEVKDFLRSQIQQAEARGRKDVAEFIRETCGRCGHFNGNEPYHVFQDQLEAAQTPEL